MNRREFAYGLFAAFVTGCASRQKQISVGTKNFTEQLILGEILAQSLEHASRAPIERRFYLAGSYICQQAILAGRIDTYVEYTGTALGAILKQTPSSSHEEALQHVKEQYSKRFNLEVMAPLGFNNSFAIVMRNEDSQRFAVRTLSQLAKCAPELRMGVGYEFIERQDGFTGLTAKYGLKFEEAPRVMDLGLLYRALESKRVDVIAGSNTDGLIDALGLVVLEDDLKYFPPYDAIPVVRRAALQDHPEIESVMQRLSGKINAEQMRRMNYAADVEKREAFLIAREFLAQSGLV